MERDANNSLPSRADERKRTASYASWITTIFPPAVWAVQMQLNYWLVRGACASGSKGPLGLATAISAIVVVVEGLFCWVAWRRLKEVWATNSNHEDSRERFLALLGLLVAAMFVLVIVAQGLATIFIAPCQT